MNDINIFLEILQENQIKIAEPMHLHTSFRVGGACDVFVLPSTDEELAGVVRICKERNLPFYILGRGSNILVGDAGYRGVMISTKNMTSTLQLEDTTIEASAGLSLHTIATFAYEHALTGFAFASGIPGSLGGAIVMNAGAYGGEMVQVLESVKVIEKDGEIVWLEASDLEFGYRKSNIVGKNRVVLGARIHLTHGNKEEIKAEMEDLSFRRKDKQPLTYPSAGSTFKRPKGYFAGKLIDDAGLRGFGIGGAQVSEKHCGFIINKADASARDILDTIDAVKKCVYEKYGVALECEVRILGEF